MTIRITTGALVLLTFGGPDAGTPAHRERDTIRLVARLRVARAAATATTIAGDRVLIAGGMAEGGAAVRSYEVFGARSNTVVTVGDMGEQRVGHTATFLPDGRVLVIGGYNGAYLKSAEIFDPRLGRFAPAGTMREGRSGHTATLLRDGTVLVAGGIGDGWTFLSSSILYDPRTARFTPAGPMGSARESHTATLLLDGRVLVTGGHRGRRERIIVYASTEIFEPARGRFVAGPTLGTMRHKHDAVALADGRVLIMGGSDPRDRTRSATTEIYDPSSNAITAGPAMRLARYKFRDTALRLRDGRILVGGGGRYAEVFDPKANAFSTVNGDLGRDYAFASSTLLSNGEALVVGGYDDSMRNSSGIWRFHE
ncbi:MAG: hypothetical protein H0W30_18630 [Gemmatimonadaceae bacterium]|nr:hypothetical protein [Gemmatimonadaceae bacterium]